MAHRVRGRRHRNAGMRRIVEDTLERVLLEPAPLFQPTRPEDVFGSLPYQGPPKTLNEMKVEVEMRRRHVRGKL